MSRSLSPNKKRAWAKANHERLRRIDVDREILRILQDDGWHLAARRGSQRQYKHPWKPGRVTVPGKPDDDRAPGTLNRILTQAGLEK